MYGLPQMIYSDGISKSIQTSFGGYNHNLYAGDGEIWDMENMTSTYAPLLSPRRPRYLLRTLTKPGGFYAHEGLYWVDGTALYKDGEPVEGLILKDGEKQFVSLGDLLVILPDKLFYHAKTNEIGSLEANREVDVSIENGTFAGEEAKANTIRVKGENLESMFKPGDGVTIKGCQTHPENDLTIVIREVERDGVDTLLRFYENSFVINEGGDTETITISREMPDLDYICENENRLWGCKGDTIYACKLGDPTNWNVFDGLATDSYAVDVGSAGSFTGCCRYLGYPCFFKEENIYKVYGSKPSNFQVMGSASLGVERGSGRSLAIAGEILFYLSRTGIVAYTGGTPQSIATPFGTERYKNAVAGSDGIKYYVSMEDSQGQRHLFVYDTRHQMWHREDDTDVFAFAWDTELYFLNRQGQIWLSGEARTVPEGAVSEGPVSSWVEFGDYTIQNPNKKTTGKLQLRVELDAGASLTVSMMFDGDGVWRAVKTLETTVKRSFYLPIIPRRSDHYRIKLEGVGGWRLYSLVRENSIGSEL